MKKTIAVLALMLMGGMAFASTAVWRSSYTATADSAKALCTGNGNTRKALLHGVCVGDATVGTFTVYDASSTAVNPIAILRSSAAAISGCQFYDVVTSSGLVYTNSNANPTTILYNCW